ncbi:MAG: endonuclease III domain-containing protein [Thermodesulfobacteriota bacterium]
MSKHTTRGLLMDYYHAMRSHFGHRNWWPADSPFEVCVGAILTQNTAWKNVVRAIDNLKHSSSLDPHSIHAMTHEQLAELIRPAGYFNVKARRLKNLIAHIVEHHGADLDSLLAQDSAQLRKALLSINGVGNETADSIILYAAGKPVFVVDAYTKRVLVRHGFVPPAADYTAMQELFHRHIPPDAELYNDFHAQFVAVGHHFCKRKPLCDQCPLAAFKKPVGPPVEGSTDRK